MVLRDTDIPIVHTTEDGYPLNDLQAARLKAVIDGEARQHAWTTNMPRIAMSYDESEYLLCFTVTTRDGETTATATLDSDGWTVTCPENPQYDTAGYYEDGWRRGLALTLLTSIGVIEPPPSRWQRLSAWIRSSLT